MLQNVKNFVKSFIMAAAIFCNNKNNLQDKWERFPPQITAGQKTKIEKLHVFVTAIKILIKLFMNK